ncbi:lactonase family protein [Caballeronia sordidicola]|uniref:lactonase family protein n=1 Tax=Caballeronia sordidicola TaxID=196367 RepID=UPI00068CFD82|nr:beta-propeller fold lactonase family protein [Caballeronia sordidicola]
MHKSQPTLRPVNARRRFCLMAAGTAVTTLGATVAHAANANANDTTDHPPTQRDINADASNRAPTSSLSIAGVGATLHTFRIDETQGSLQNAGVLTVPAPVQYAWRHPRMPLLYVAYSNGSPTTAGDHHGLATLHVQADGTLTEAFAPLTLHNRPINITVSPDGKYALVAYNAPSAVTVHALSPHGQPHVAIPQNSAIDAGVYAHQVRVTPDGNSVLLVTRGNDAKPTKPEDPGAIKQFSFQDGQLSNERSIAPHGGFGFGPRHLDFHPTQPWVFVSLERENQMMVFSMRDGQLAETPIFTVSTVRDTAHQQSRQMVSAIHISRDGRFVYVSNRANGIADVNGQKVFAGGENSLTVFSIDQSTGAPTRLQSIDTDSFNPRTFALTTDGRMAISGAIESMAVRHGDDVQIVPASLTLFHIGQDGRMTLAGKTDVQTSGQWMFWTGAFDTSV